MNERELAQEIKKYSQKRYGDPPPTEQTWRSIVPHILVQEEQVSWWRRVRTTRPFWQRQHVVVRREDLLRRPTRHIRIALVILLVALLTVAATTYAATGSGLLTGLFDFLGAGSIQPQFSDYHQSKSIDGYTLTIQKAYADANRVLIGLTGEAPTGKEIHTKFSLTNIEMTTDQGMELRPIGGISSGGSESGELFAFDASSIQGTPKELHVHLSIPYHSGSHIEGSLTFSLAIPFHPGKKVQVNHSVTASGTPGTKQIIDRENGQQMSRQAVTLNGLTVILEQVVIAPSETRAYVRGFSNAFSPGMPLELTCKITVDGQIYQAAGIGEGTGVWRVNFDDPSLANQKGSWTLTIQQEISQVNPATGKYGPEPVPGALWTFQFAVA